MKIFGRPLSDFESPEAAVDAEECELYIYEMKVQYRDLIDKELNGRLSEDEVKEKEDLLWALEDSHITEDIEEYGKILSAKDAIKLETLVSLSKHHQEMIKDMEKYKDAGHVSQKTYDAFERVGERIQEAMKKY